MSRFLNNIHPLLSRKKLKDSDPSYAVLNAIDAMLSDVETDTINSRTYSFLHTATGKYLEEFGSWYGVYRLDNETDRNYRSRIVKYLQMPRGTNQALILATRRYLNDPTVGIRIYEPWTNVFMLNKSLMNGPDKLMGKYYRFAVVEVSIGVPFDSDLVAYLKRFLTAGVELHVNYDSSIPRTTEQGGDIASPILNITSYSPVTEGEILSGLVKNIGGRIRLSDRKDLSNPYVLDESKMNGLDVLTGSFNQYRDNLHVFGYSQNMVPKLTSLLGESKERITEPDVNRELMDQIDVQEVSIPLNPSEEMYISLNLDSFVNLKYYGKGYKIVRTRERYAELFNNSAFTWVYNVDKQGYTLSLQVYNFKNKQWETLSSQITQTSNEKRSVFVENVYDCINNNRLMFVRFKVSNACKINLNYFSYDFKQQV